jgi:dephospho-CoA kinase
MTVTHQRQLTDRLVIGITGRIGSGKTSTAKYLSSSQGFQYLRYSLVLSEWRASQGEGKFRLQEIGWEVMSGGLQSELNDRLISQIKPSASAVVDGLRHPIDFESLRRSFLPCFHLFYIDSPRNLRWQRLRENGRYTTEEQFNAADSHPVEQQIEILRTKAERIFENDQSIEALYELLYRAILSLRSEG